MGNFVGTGHRDLQDSDTHRQIRQKGVLAWLSRLLWRVAGSCQG